jgi:hypothetical protein
MFGEFARKHEDLNIAYRLFFRTHLPLIIQTVEYDNVFERLEGSDADQVHAQFRKLVQQSLRGKKLVASHQSIIRTSIEVEDDNDDDDGDDSMDLDYEPDDNEKGDDEKEDEEDKEDDNEEYDTESSEGLSEEEENTTT